MFSSDAPLARYSSKALVTTLYHKWRDLKCIYISVCMCVYISQVYEDMYMQHVFIEWSCILKCK